MKRLLALLCLAIAAPALAKPQMTVLLPIAGAMPPQVISDTFRGSASVRAGMAGLPASLITTSLYTSDVALVVLDATQGPLPANREHVLAARQARVPHVFVLITNVDALFGLVGEADGRELLGLEEQEIRTVLELYGVGGADTHVYHDSANAGRATASMAGDLRSLVEHLGTLPRSARDQDDLQPTRAAKGEIYLLAVAESNGNAVEIDGSRNLELWISGHSKPAVIQVEGTARPGDAVAFQFTTESPVSAAPGARMMLLHNDRIVGVGVVTALQ